MKVNKILHIKNLLTLQSSSQLIYFEIFLKVLSKSWFKLFEKFVSGNGVLKIAASNKARII